MMVISVVVFICLFLFAITFHEFCHGFVAYSLGDTTARDQGRLTLNPLRHVDLLWTVGLPLALVLIGMPAIGMAKPVPVNFLNLRHRKRGMVGVAVAGPIANLLFAAILSNLYRWSNWNVWLYGVYLNLGLALFNLIPVPPLDGSRILSGILPNHWARRYSRVEPYGFAILLGLVLLGWLWPIIIPAFNFFCALLGVPKIAFGSAS